MDRIYDVLQQTAKTSTKYDERLKSQITPQTMQMFQKQKKASAEIFNKQESLMNVVQKNKIAQYLSSSFFKQNYEVINTTNFAANDYKNLSIVPVLLKQLKNFLTTILELQFKIDPETKQFYKIKNLYVFDIVDKIIKNLKKQNGIMKVMSIIIQNWIITKDQLRKFYTTLFTEVYNKFKLFRFTVDLNQFYSAIIDPYISTPVEQKQVIQIQTRALTYAKNKWAQVSPLNAVVYELQIIENYIKKKRGAMEPQQFHFYSDYGIYQNLKTKIPSLLQNQLVEIKETEREDKEQQNMRIGKQTSLYKTKKIMKQKQKS